MNYLLLSIEYSLKILVNTLPIYDIYIYITYKTRCVVVNIK